MKGKEKCKALKEIRRQIAETNDIPFAVSQCTHQGDCKGTCPKCESELRYLERELAIRQGLGKAVAIAGISIGACTTFTACSPMDTVTDFLEGIGIRDHVDELAGSTTLAEPDDGNIEDFDFGTPPADDTITGMETDAPIIDGEEDALAGNVKPFDWENDPAEEPEMGEVLPEIEGDIAVPPTPEPDETLSATEGAIPMEP